MSVRNSFLDYEVAEYHDTPILKYWSKAMCARVFYGVELECVLKTSFSDDCANTLVALKDKKQIFITEDGSLPSYGVEIISHPMTLEMHKISKVWEEVCSTKLRAKNLPECGMHVHISREGFANGVHLFKFAKFFNNSKLVLKIAERGYNEYANQWSEPQEQSIKNTCDGETRALRYYDRYKVVNLSNQNTVEVRIFKSVISHMGILAKIQLCDAVRIWSKKTEDLSDESFAKYVIAQRKRYPELLKRLIGVNDDEV